MDVDLHVSPTRSPQSTLTVLPPLTLSRLIYIDPLPLYLRPGRGPSKVGLGKAE